MRGVTVTQLESIDPTLVVYRAEATFVGLTVWDLYSALNSPAMVRRWNAALDDATLIQDLGGQSAVWHVRYALSLIHISEPTRHSAISRMPSSA